MQHHLVRLSLIAAIFVMPTNAFAACWKLPNSSIVETSSRSTPPMRGAKRVSCSRAKAAEVQQSRPKVVDQPAEPRGVREWGRQRDPRECVAFARSLVPKLPTGLFSFDDKRKIITSSQPEKGSVAIIRVRSGSFAKYGHVAVVLEVTTNSITLSEANWKSGYRQYRKAVGKDLRDAERQLNILGYFKP